MQKNQRTNKIITVLLTFMIVLGLMFQPLFAVRVSAIGTPPSTITAETTSWSYGNMQLTEGEVTINSIVTLKRSLTLTVNEGCHLIINGGICCEGGTYDLTVDGGGTVDVYGTRGRDGKNWDEYGGGNGENGNPGNTGVACNIIINNGVMSVTGGDGGKGGSANPRSVSYCGGDGNRGGIGVNGNITVNGGLLSVKGGNGGFAGWGPYNIATEETLCGVNGNGKNGVAGNVTLNGGSIIVVGGYGGRGAGYYYGEDATAFAESSVITIASGLHYGIDRTGDYTGTLDNNAKAAANGKRLDPIYRVTINAGTGMTRKTASGAAPQDVFIGTTMDSVVYEADDGYYFPSSYSVDSVNGVSVTCDNYRQITVSGTPSTHTEITLNAAAEQTMMNADSVRFTVTGADTGTLSGLTSSDEYVVTGAASASFIASGTSKEISGVTAGTLTVVRKGNGAELGDSLPKNFTVSKASIPDSVTATACSTESNNNGKLSGITTAMEYKKSDSAVWTDGTGEDIAGLTNGTYYVRVKASGTTLSSDNLELVIKEAQTISAEDVTVTYGDTDKSVSGTVTGSLAGGEISYAVKSGSEEYIDVHTTTGALAIKKVPSNGKAYVVVTAAETASFGQTTKDVTVNINKATPVVTAPTAKTLTASGSALLLVNPGSTSGGTLKYAVGMNATTVPTSGWDIEIPSKAEAGTYYVWYRVEADQNWTDAGSFAPVKVVIKAQASNTTTDSDPTQSNTGTSTDPDPSPAVVTPVHNSTPVSENIKEVSEPSIITRKNKDGSLTTIRTIRNADGTTTVITETVSPDGTTETKEETRDAKGNGSLKIEKKDAKGNLLSKTEGTIVVNKKGTETIKSITENADGSREEKTQKTYKRDANGIKKITVSAKKTDAEGNTEKIKRTELIGILGDATVTEKSTYKGVGADGKTVVTVKEERQYAMSVNGRVKLMSLKTDGEKVTIPESIEVDGVTRVVKVIGKNALKGNKTIKEVVIRKNITTICTGAFKNCKNLELVKLTGSVKKIYKNAFKGIAENAKFVIEASEEDFERIVELIKKSGVSDTVTFERV